MSKEAIFEKIKEYSRIMLFRHFRIDGDCVGSTKGFQEVLRATFPEKEIYLIDDEKSDYLAFLGADDAPVADELYRDALGIVIDTATAERISSPKYTLCREVAKIDHHIEVPGKEGYFYATDGLSWVEEERSSACEMIAAFCASFPELQLNRRAATCLYTGMVTDSGRFQYPGVSGETMRLAGLLLDVGVDTEWLYANLYLREFESLKFKAYVYEHMTISGSGVASIYLSRETQQAFGLTFEEASSCISYLDGIKGCLCWLAFIETGDAQNSVRVRLRSRFVHINTLAEQYRGGGHACASGATVYGEGEIRELTAKADQMVREYKETHEEWL